MHTSRLLPLLLVASLAFAEEAPKSKFVAALAAGKPQTIVTYGTSLTAGGAWVQQLAKALDAKYPKLPKVINSGASGMWSKWGVDHLDERVISKHPDAVFIEWGINDAFLQYKTTVEQAREYLNNQIDRILKANPEAEIILMVMNPPIAEHLARRPKILDYYQMYRDVAKERKLLLVDHYPNWQKVLDQGEAEYRKLVPDGIHPNAKGCGEVITPGILKALGLG